MKLTLDSDPSLNLIRRYSDREIVIGDRALNRSCIVAPTALIEDWTFDSIQALTLDELKPILELDPEVILLGTGDRQVFPPAALLSWCLNRRIALEAMDLGAACRTYNVLAQEDRRVIGGFVLGS